MLIEEIRSRQAEIVAELDNNDLTEERLNELEEEVDKLEAEERAIVEQAKQRKLQEAKVINAVENGNTEPVEIINNTKERTKMTELEYRNKFYDYLRGDCARTALINVDGDTAEGDYIAIPKTLDEKIWDNIHSAHPILNDISILNTGIALEVTKHTAGTPAEKKKDKADTAGAEDNTFVKVILNGKDYQKFVELTYAEAKMSNGALETYLAEEIANALGEALAEDVFAKIIADVGTGKKVAKTGDWFADIAGALGKATGANQAIIYCSPANYYAIFGSVDTNKQPIFRDGVAVGAEVKKDSACGDNVVIVEPGKFVLNQVSQTIIESTKDLRNHRIVVSGWMRAEGTMRDNNAGAYIA